MFFSLGGIPGVGKTTVMQYTLQLAWEEGFGIQDAHKHRILYELAGVSSKFQYVQLPHATRAGAHLALIDRLRVAETADPNGIRIRDDHFAYPHSDGSCFIRPINSMDYQYLVGIFILTADPPIILARRIDDDLALRPEHTNDTLATVTAHQCLEISTACQQAAVLGIPFRMLENDGNSVEDVARKLLRFIQEVYS